jgi:hypothetical protein
MFSLLRRLRKSFGYDKYSSQTFDRLLQSAHVEDLRWVVVVTTVAAFVIVPGLLFGIIREHPEALVSGGVLLAFGAIVPWCYRAGSQRLGVVDLFACEITTLCRICTVVGLVDACVTAFDLKTNLDRPSDYDNKFIKIRSSFSHFDSSEVYTPVFNANAMALQNLSVKTLTNITAFYTYWKASASILPAGQCVMLASVRFLTLPSSR